MASDRVGWVPTALRVALAAVFVVSAVAKLMAIDDFEMYIFSYGFVPLNAAYILARLCIVAEAALGVLLAVGWWRRWVSLAALCLLLFFSLFLCYAALAGRDDSCQCMGRLADMPPAVSLLKNAVLTAMALGVNMSERRKGVGKKEGRGRCIVATVGCVAVLAAVFAVSVPDNWMFGASEMPYDKALLDEVVEERDLGSGHMMVAFVTPGCPYCQLSREKIGSIVKRHGIDTVSIAYLEPGDIGAQRFMDLTYGSRPLIILLDDGTPVATYHYRNISEAELAGFLPQR